MGAARRGRGEDEEDEDEATGWGEVGLAEQKQATKGIRRAHHPSLRRL